jgi:hypothetical protein
LFLIPSPFPFIPERVFRNRTRILPEERRKFVKPTRRADSPTAKSQLSSREIPESVAPVAAQGRKAIGKVQKTSWFDEFVETIHRPRQPAVCGEAGNDPRIFLTATDYSIPGAAMTYKLFVRLTTGNESGGGAMTVTRQL